MEGKVIESEEELEEVDLDEEELEEDEPEEVKPSKKTAKKKIAEPKAGDILNYTKEVDTYVIDEEGKNILCSEENKDMVQAKTLSLLFEIKQMLGKREK